MMHSPWLTATYVTVVLVLLSLLLGVAIYLATRRRQAEQRALEMARLSDKLRRARDDLRTSEERYALAALGSHDGLWDWDLKRNQIFFSPRWKAMLGYAESQITSDPREWMARVHPDDVQRLRGEINAHLDLRTEHLESEYRVLHRDGAYRWMLIRGLAIRSASGAPIRMAGSQTDITSRRLAEEQLTHAALHDTLTGLPNRSYFNDALGRSIARAKRRLEYRFAVLFLDFDRFKLINDSLGHSVGDQLLWAIARRLESCLRPGDVIARLGGDEFAVLLDDIGETSDATHVAERMHNVLTQAFNVGPHEIFISSSIGIAFSETGYDLPEDLLRDADLAMYRAKAQGKACYEIFDVAMRVTARARLQLESDLRRAIDRREFELHYQPIVSLANGRIAGFEALVRWRHPQRGLINAAAFVPLAEETGFIIPIGQWVVREACRQMREWQLRYPSEPTLTISVNLSARELLQPRLSLNIEEALRDTSLPPNSLRLEITESVFLDGADAAIVMFNELKSLGVLLHLDDFGTGYSSLSYLHRFPINSVKIDRYFVSRLHVNQECLAIVGTILDLARNLGMEVIAEGAELEEQRLRLEALACPYVQGYLFSRPVSANDAEVLIAAQMAQPPRVTASSARLSEFSQSVPTTA